MEVVRQKNAATYIVFPIVDADGDLVTSAADLDSELDAWTDGAAPDGFADCTNEATEIGSTGMYYLSLTQTEMNNDYIVVQVQTSTSGAKTQVILIRTIVGDPLNIATTDDATAIDGSALNTLSGHDPGETIMGATDLGTGSGLTSLATAAELAKVPKSDGTTSWNATALAAINAECDTAISDASLATSANVAAVETDTQDIQSKLGTPSDFGSGTSTIAANLQDMADNGTATFDRATDSLQAIRDRGDSAWTTATGFSTLDEAGIRTAVGLSSANLDTQLDALPTAAENADAVWDEATVGHTTSGTFGEQLKTDVDAILDDTGTSGVAVSAASLTLVESITDTSVAEGLAGLNDPTAAAIADAVWDESTAGHTTSGTFGEQLKTDVDAILVDTAEIGSAGVGLTAVGLAADGLDNIPVTSPGGVASTFPEMIVQLWRRVFKKSTQTSTTLTTYEDDGTTATTTQTLSDSGGTQTQGAAS